MSQSFTGFTVIFFAIEVVMLLAAFRGRFFRHLGYVVDLLVVSTCLYQDMAGNGKGKSRHDLAFKLRRSCGLGLVFMCHLRRTCVAEHSFFCTIFRWFFAACRTKTRFSQP